MFAGIGFPLGLPWDSYMQHAVKDELHVACLHVYNVDTLRMNIAVCSAFNFDDY